MTVCRETYLEAFDSCSQGQPTSIHLAMTASVNHRDLMKDLKERDVTPVNDEQTPDLC